MENHSFEWVNQLQMAIFNCYVSLPEGKLWSIGSFVKALFLVAVGCGMAAAGRYFR